MSTNHTGYLQVQHPLNSSFVSISVALPQIITLSATNCKLRRHSQSQRVDCRSALTEITLTLTVGTLTSTFMADLAALGSVWLCCTGCAGVLSSSSYCCSMVEIAELPDNNLFVVFFSVLSLGTQLVSDKRRALPRRKVPAAPPDFLLLDLLLLLLRVL